MMKTKAKKAKAPAKTMPLNMAGEKGISGEMAMMKGKKGKKAKKMK